MRDKERNGVGKVFGEIGKEARRQLRGFPREARRQLSGFGSEARRQLGGFGAEFAAQLFGTRRRRRR